MSIRIAFRFVFWTSLHQSSISPDTLLKAADVFSDPALQETVRQISPLFGHFATVMAFAEESTFVPGQVVQALGAALRSHLKNYMVRTTLGINCTLHLTSISKDAWFVGHLLIKLCSISGTEKVSHSKKA